MSRAKPTAKELLDACRVLGVVVLVDGDQLVIRHAPPDTERFLRKHRRALVQRILGKGAA